MFLQDSAAVRPNEISNIFTTPGKERKHIKLYCMRTLNDALTSERRKAGACMRLLVVRTSVKTERERERERERPERKRERKRERKKEREREKERERRVLP